MSDEESVRRIVNGMPGLICIATVTGAIEVVSLHPLEYFGKTLETLNSWSILAMTWKTSGNMKGSVRFSSGTLPWAARHSNISIRVGRLSFPGPGCGALLSPRPSLAATSTIFCP